MQRLNPLPLTVDGNRRRQRGVTLIELLLTVTVFAVLLSIGVPSFSEFLRNNARTTRLNEMIGAFAIARSEAITRRTTVTLCESAAPFTACNNAPNPPTSGAFEGGWIVFQDDNGTRGVVDAGDVMLRVFQPDMAGSATLTFTHTDDSQKIGFVTFEARGRPMSWTNPRTILRYCDKRGAADSVSVINVNRSGQVRVQNKKENSGDANLTRNMRCPS